MSRGPLSSAMALAPAGAVQLHGLLGDAQAASHRGRLSTFIGGPASPAIELFDPARADANTCGDWYGEHAGKWLVAAARAAARTGDATLRSNVLAVADALAARQRDDGYLGTYAPGVRFTDKQPPRPPSWDGAPSQRTWDLWIHAYLVLGLLEVHRHFADARHLRAAERIGDLVDATLRRGDIVVTELGNHFGMSATVFLDAAMALHDATGEARFVALAERVLAQANDDPALALVERALAGADPSEIATGKAYQLLWNLVGVAKLHRATGRGDCGEAVERLWTRVRDHHLSLGGGPWGGVAHRSREVFNPAAVFSPHGYVETCSTLAWLQLNRELLALTGQPRYAEEIERSAYNDLLGALAPDGEDWCYYVFPNGRRTHTTYWRCCKSSGAMALEELSAVAYASTADGIAVNLLGPGRAVLDVPGAGAVEIVQATRYPAVGTVRLRITPATTATFELRLRIPAWATGAVARLPGGEYVLAPPGDYLRVVRAWRPGDVVELDLPMPVRLHRACNRNVQESVAPDGEPVAQEVLRQDFVAITRGPLVYATGLVDGYRTGETVRLPEPPAQATRLEPPDPAGPEPRVLLLARDRPPIPFVPYYRAGGRHDGAWRLTWLSLPPAEAGADPAQP